MRAQVIKTRLAAFPDSHGQARVISDTCVHRGGELGNGKVNDFVQYFYAQPGDDNAV